MPRLDPEFPENTEAARQRHQPRPTVAPAAPAEPVHGEAARQDGTPTAPAAPPGGRRASSVIVSTAAVISGLAAGVLAAIRGVPRIGAVRAWHQIEAALRSPLTLTVIWIVAMITLPTAFPRRRRVICLLLWFCALPLMVYFGREVRAWLSMELGQFGS